MHCDCAYFINTYRHDWPTLAALICPRPLLMLNSSDDRYYPPEGYTRVLDKVQRIYDAHGEVEKTGMFEVGGPHGYTQAQREKAVEWSDRWLKGIESDIHERPFEPIPGEQLAAFNGDIPDDAINAEIQERLIPAKVLDRYTTLESWEKRKAEVMTDLTSVVFRNMPRSHTALKTIPIDGDSFALETEPGILVGMSSHFPGGEQAKQPALVYVASPGEDVDAIWNFLRSYPFQNDVTARYIVYPRGIGMAVWNGTETRRFERSAMLLGRTVDEMRLHDILCAVDHVASQPWFGGENLTITGKGEQGILGAYAALLDKRISRIILHSPTVTHHSAPTFLNVLRYTDIPEVLGMLAPRELVFLTWEIYQFRATRDLYSLYGAEDKVWRGQTVTQVLNRNR